jgi:hypothetical protein
MKAQGYTNSNEDVCLYTKNCSNGGLIMLILYVDYMLIVSKNYKDKLSLLKKNLSETFDMKDLGDDDIFFVCILLVIGVNDTSIVSP